MAKNSRKNGTLIEKWYFKGEVTVSGFYVEQTTIAGKPHAGISHSLDNSYSSMQIFRKFISLIKNTCCTLHNIPCSIHLRKKI